MKGAMRDMKVHLDKHGDDAAECAMETAETNNKSGSNRGSRTTMPHSMAIEAEVR